LDASSDEEGRFKYQDLIEQGGECEGIFYKWGNASYLRPLSFIEGGKHREGPGLVRRSIMGGRPILCRKNRKEDFSSGEGSYKSSRTSASVEH